MDIIINELSLTGQFSNERDFLDNVKKLLPIIKIIDKLKFNLLKEHSFFNSKITNVDTLHDVLYSKKDEIRRIKSYISKLSTPPFWNDSKKHDCSKDIYLFNGNNICNTSLAETCQRNKIVLSFNHNDYQNKELAVRKNTNNINVFNIIDKSDFLEKLYQDQKIPPLDFCCFKFENSNINFQTLEESFGFGSLTADQIRAFIKSFDKFSSMDWVKIEKDNGFQYKPYTGTWFNNNINININKFRVSQKYRCFGYRKGDVFNVLRFETDHKQSDQG